jgi:hypothetical protein
MVGVVLAGGPSAVAAAQLFGRPVRPVLDANGHGPARIANQVETSNWSGYVVARFETGHSYTSASGTWVVPTASQPSPGAPGYSASWVGIGGFCKNARCHAVDNTLIQLGTEQDVNALGATTYGAWYEMLPNAPVPIPVVVVSPGDTVTATLSDGAVRRHGPKKADDWTLTFTDVTTNKTWSTHVAYRSSLASAEWIQEAPASGRGILPLADYGTATFDPGSANGANPDLLASQAVVMVDPQGQTSNPSAPDADTDGFATCWGSGVTLMACPAPAT